MRSTRGRDRPRRSRVWSAAAATAVVGGLAAMSAAVAVPGDGGLLWPVGILVAIPACVALGFVANWRVIAAVVLGAAVVTSLLSVILGAHQRREPDQCDRFEAGPPSNGACWVTVPEQAAIGACAAILVLTLAGTTKLIRDNPAPPGTGGGV